MSKSKDFHRIKLDSIAQILRIEGNYTALFELYLHLEGNGCNKIKLVYELIISLLHLFSEYLLKNIQKNTANL